MQTMWISCSAFFLLSTIVPLVQPSNQWRSNDDISKIYDSATPNPTGSLSGPWFDMPGFNPASPNTVGNVTFVGVKGKISHLVCRVKNLGNHTVTWIRYRDLHLLTIGLFTYTLDPRFSAIHRANSEDWVLEIRNTQLSDGGDYGCQISTTPIRKHVVHLSVAEPKISIPGGSEMHINSGSTLNVTCHITGYPKALGYVTWYKDRRSLHGSNRHNISLDQFKIPGDSQMKFVSSVVVQRAVSDDTGVYMCSSEAGDSGEATVHVITGETRAGLQVNSVSKTEVTFKILFITLSEAFRLLK